MTTRIQGVLRRDVEVTLGANWLEREWPSGAAWYRVELSPEGIRVRLNPRGAWYRIPWEDILPNASPEVTVPVRRTRGAVSP